MLGVYNSLLPREACWVCITLSSTQGGMLGVLYLSLRTQGGMLGVLYSPFRTQGGMLGVLYSCPRAPRGALRFGSREPSRSPFGLLVGVYSRAPVCRSCG